MKMKYMKNGQSLTLRVDKCIGCGACVDVCPHGVFMIEGRKATIVGRDYCMECGACARNCPTAALTVQPGVGCAAAIIMRKLRGTTPTCGGDAGCGEGSGGPRACC